MWLRFFHFFNIRGSLGVIFETNEFVEEYLNQEMDLVFDKLNIKDSYINYMEYFANSKYKSLSRYRKEKKEAFICNNKKIEEMGIKILDFKRKGIKKGRDSRWVISYKMKVQYREQYFNSLVITFYKSDSGYTVKDMTYDASEIVPKQGLGNDLMKNLMDLCFSYE